MRRRWHQLVLGTAVSAAALALALRGARLEVIGRVALEARWGALALSLLFYFGVTVVLRSVVVRTLLVHLKPVGLTVPYRYVLIGFLANSVLPLRLGEVVRSAFLALRMQIPAASVIAALALERMVDMSVVVGLTGLASAVMPVPTKIKAAAGLTALILLALFVVLAWASRSGVRLMERIPAWLPRRVAGLIERQSDLFLQGLTSLRRRSQFVTAAGVAVLLWVSMVPMLDLRLYAFGLALPPQAGLLLLVALTFGQALPSMPGYVGVYHLAVVFTLGAYGVAPDRAAAVAVLMHAVDMISVCIAGAVALFLEGISPKRLLETGLGPSGARPA